VLDIESSEARLRRARRQPLFDVANVPRIDLARGDIERVLPHRGRMLLLDRVTHLDANAGTAVAARKIDSADPVFQDHFPGDPLYPGVLQVEMGGQLGLFLACYKRTAHSDAPMGTKLIRVQDAVFLSEVRPGFDITVLAEIEEDDGYVLSCRAQLLHGETIICVAAFDAMLVEHEL